jgi:hypothetical protein
MDENSDHRIEVLRKIYLAELAEHYKAARRSGNLIESYRLMKQIANEMIK